MFLKSLFILSFSSLLCASTTYTMKDLEALEGTANFEEFFDHAKDIRPSLRDKVWQKITTSMADSYLDSLIESLAINDKQFNRVKEISKWEALSSDEFYIKKRNKFFNKYISQCMENKDLESCYDLSKSIFHTFNEDKEFGVRIAEQLNTKIIEQNKDSKASQTKTYDLWSFIQPMIKTEFSEFYCNKAPTFDILKAKITQDKKLRKILHKDCLKVVLPKLKDELASFEPFKRKTAYMALESLDSLDKGEKSQYLVSQLLSGFPFNKENWGHAYNALKELGANEQLREKLLTYLKSLDTLPDKLFTLENKKKVLVIVKQISNNFPEYLDHYTTQCLKYLNGDKSFPKGNPTPNCHSYFKLAKVVKSSPELITKKYDTIMNSWKK
ncbi:MAG: hypothetical protein KC478_02940 [Bacteriovoracaceae bacterium]|nr:hypothetical protein [Bacteriovoracaceae bacterium]